VELDTVHGNSKVAVHCGQEFVDAGEPLNDVCSASVLLPPHTAFM